MSDSDDHAKPRASLPKAKIKKTRRAWWLWLVPLGAVALCAWFVYRDYIATGPLVTISFEDASGLEENNTQIRYLGATIGQVKSLQLTKDNKHVEVKARLAGSATQLARVGSVFWIVRPEVKLGGISGLRTIISGEYVAVRPGSGPPTNNFVGAEKEPISEEPGSLHITLLVQSLSTLREQSAIYYRGVEVGELLKYQLADDAQGLVLQARIRKEYAPLVRENSKFWNAGGIDFRFGLFRGAEISAESAKTLLGGGIEFNTPPEIGAPATDGAVFRLYDKPEDVWKNWMPIIHLDLPEQASETTKSKPLNQSTPLGGK
ncbi:MAG TPA: MlaD family protein [Verrucomicrobiae bacterium]|jgi:paraquat-inducible protein B|nr:MlaD family protein [Verrucomicrobiae bacterium]